MANNEGFKPLLTSVPLDNRARNRSFSVPNYHTADPTQPLLAKQPFFFPYGFPMPMSQPQGQPQIQPLGQPQVQPQLPPQHQFQPQHPPPPYGSVVPLPSETPYGIPLHMFNPGMHQPMMPYHAQSQMPPIIMNHVPPQSQAPHASTNVVIHSNPDGGPRNNVAAAMMGGFVCPFCQVGVQIRRRSRAIKYIVIACSVLAFPIGLLSCFLCCLPCAYTSKCTTCNKNV